MGDMILKIVQMVIAIFLIPVVIASGMSMQNHFGRYPSGYDEFFGWGIVAFIFIYLFVYQFRGFYELGQKIMSTVFNFLSPFHKVLAKIFPFYTLALLFLFLAIYRFFNVDAYNHHFMFFMGFLFCFNIVLSAQEFQTEDPLPIRPSYLFWIMIIVILNIFLLIVCLDLILGKMFFDKFFSFMFLNAKKIYADVLDFIV